VTAYSESAHGQDWLGDRFEDHRAHLNAVAYRILGSASDAEDAVQESWLRLSRSNGSGVENLGAWLTTVVARVCLNMLRARRSRREETWDASNPSQIIAGDPNAESEALLADSVGLALLVVLDRLNPAERLAFVLHDLFDVPFEEIASIVNRTPAATRQLASRARRRVQGKPELADADLARRRKVIDAFLAAARAGDFEALLTVLDPEVEVRSIGIGDTSSVIRGAHTFLERVSTGGARFARFCQTALIDGQPGIVAAPHGHLFRVIRFEFSDDRIVAIEVFSGNDRLRSFDIALLRNHQ
jgi:RNA polymerase sigma factor (sigma-70 family)